MLAESAICFWSTLKHSIIEEEVGTTNLFSPKDLSSTVGWQADSNP